MRAFVFLLILANLLFLAWSQGYFGASSNPDAFRVQQQLLADQVKIVARDDPPAETKRLEPLGKAEENELAETCVQVGDLPKDEADQLEVLLGEKFSALKVVRRDVVASTSYWVYIPPLASKQDVEARVAALKKLGVTDYFVVQESGANIRAISLGLFSTKEAANSRLEALRGQGVKSAKVGERNAKPSSVSFELRGPEAQAEALRQVLLEALPESKAHACKLLSQ